MKARVILLNDFPWAVCTEPDVSDEELHALGIAECERRGWPTPGSYLGNGHTVYIRIHQVPQVTHPSEKESTK